MKKKNDLWGNIGAILACLGFLMLVGIILYKCFIVSISFFAFIFGLIIFIIGVLICALNDK